MGDFTSSAAAPPWFLVALIWIGFGTLAGLLAKAVLPGRHPNGAVGTLVIGIGGSTLGLLALHQFLLGEAERSTFNPISAVGMLAAAAGAFALLIVYRLLVACIRIDAPPDEKKNEAK
ncbi:MAG TPA: transglycosylase [Planctomycetaceae bacterium]|nr:transglycosylase [Planctomycetaceae bacterium]